MNDRIGISEIVVERCRAAPRDATFWWLRTSDALARQGTFSQTSADFRERADTEEES
jgi:hypothetical protein